MNKETTFKHIMLATVLATTLQACGGGGSSKTTAPIIPPAPINPPTAPTDSLGLVVMDKSFSTHQPIELFLYYPEDSITNITWQQTTGDSVVFHAKKSKAIAFTPTTSGHYSFEVSFQRNGNPEKLTHSFNVESGTQAISARLGHAVLEGNKVSLRASLENANINESTLRWTQTLGPSVTFDTETVGSKAVFFSAPSVDNDTLITFTVSASDSNGTYEDTVSLLIEQAPNLNTTNNSAFDARLATVHPYNADSPYAESLQRCVYDNNINYQTTCRFNELPLIAHDTTTPNVDDIMDHVVVSHNWMGDRFKEFLLNSDPHNDFKNLLRATTAIVISYDIRPSFYSVATGAIYLDPNYLWLTPQERDTINEAPDFRAAFGAQLKFAMPWRYVKNNNYTSFFYPQDMRITRQASDGFYSLAALMYHELAHANDFFPQSLWADLNQNDRILDAADEIFQGSGIQSDKLIDAYPLHGDEMYRLARVRFHGEAPTDFEKNYTSSDVGLFFSPEHAPQFYNYSSTREDYAMLFDGFMMKARFNVDRDVAVTNQPQNANEDYIVSWGQRGRIGDTNIKPRVEFVTQRILPEFTQASSVINALSAPIAMEQGKTWADNLAISPTLLKATTHTEATNTTTQNQALAQPQDGQLFFEKVLPMRKK